MKTVGDVMREVDFIQDTIQNLHVLKRMFEDTGSRDDEDEKRCCDNAIVLLARYRHVLSALPIKEVNT